MVAVQELPDKSVLYDIFMQRVHTFGSINEFVGLDALAPGVVPLRNTPYRMWMDLVKHTEIRLQVRLR